MAQNSPIAWGGDDDFTVHPVADVFPMMLEKAFNELVEDIKTNGLMSPGVTWQTPDGVLYLIDGRNRYMACKSAGIQFRIKEWKGGDPTAWIISQNLHRRHLNESQRAMVAVRLETHLAEQAKERQREGSHNGGLADITTSSNKAKANLPSSSTGHQARDDAAKLLNVSPRLVQEAKRVLDKGTDELKEAVQRGEVSVSAAAQVAKKPAEDQRTIVEAGPAAIKEAAKAEREKPSIVDPVIRALNMIEKELKTLSDDDKARIAPELHRIASTLERE